MTITDYLKNDSPNRFLNGLSNPPFLFTHKQKNKSLPKGKLSFLVRMTITDYLKYIFHGVIIHILSHHKSFFIVYMRS